MNAANKSEARKIGSKQGIIAVAIGLIIAQLIMTLLISTDEGLVKGFLWFTKFEYKLNIFIGAVVMLICGYFFGQIGGIQIIIKRRNHILVGFLCGLGVLLTTGFLAGWIGFFQEGIKNIGTYDNPFVDYLFKPLFWITIFGGIPSLLVGIWFGTQIKRKGKAINSSITASA